MSLISIKSFKSRAKRLLVEIKDSIDCGSDNEYIARLCDEFVDLNRAIKLREKFLKELLN